MPCAVCNNHFPLKYMLDLRTSFLPTCPGCNSRLKIGIWGWVLCGVYGTLAATATWRISNAVRLEEFPVLAAGAILAGLVYGAGFAQYLYFRIFKIQAK